MKTFILLFIGLTIGLISYSQSASPVGNPMKVGKLEIAQNDFANTMSWDDAVKVCADLGNGWRLPTKLELNELYDFFKDDKANIGNFKNDNYWSSTGTNDGFAWDQYLNSGQSDYSSKLNKDLVRAVRDLK
jgi:hypothetical protein